VKARWCFDAKFGHKQEAIKLLQEWIQKVTEATQSTTGAMQISHGAVGTPESRIELEVELESLAELESFWGSVPSKYHREWANRMQDRIVDGTPQWTVHHVVQLTSDISSPAEGSVKSKANRSSLPDQILKEMKKQDAQETSEEGVVLGGDMKNVLDWKGDVMTINPGDVMPFNF